MAHATKGHRWLLAIPVTGIVIGFLWLAFEPIFGVLSMLWLPAVIAAGLGAAMWKWGANQVLEVLGNKLVRGLAIFALLLALYVYIGQLGYGSLDFFAGFMGVTRLVAAMILLTVALLLTPLPAVVITLFKPTGIPIDEKVVIQGSRGVAIIILTILFVRGLNVEGWGENIVSELQAAEAAISSPATGRGTAATPRSRTLALGNEWRRVEIPMHHWFQLTTTGRVRVRLQNGQEFEKSADGRWFNAHGELISGLPNVIPGLSVNLRSASGEPEQVIFETWPK